jgi:hypothetical protein
VLKTGETSIMDMHIYKKQLQETVVVPMTEYMNDCEDCGFKQKDIKKCEGLILTYLSALEHIKKPADKKIMKHVKTLVLALNKLNEKTDYCLLETEERESICEFIQESAIACGLSDPSDDITEEWRDF